MYSAVRPTAEKVLLPASINTLDKTSSAETPIIQCVAFSALQREIPASIYAGFDAFINRKVDASQREWIKRIEERFKRKLSFRLHIEFSIGCTSAAGADGDGSGDRGNDNVIGVRPVC